MAALTLATLGNMTIKIDIISVASLNNVTKLEQQLSLLRSVVHLPNVNSALESVFSLESALLGYRLQVLR
jgi:hypothetical protein